MKKILKLTFYLLVLLHINISNAEEKIVFVNLDFLFQETKAGKSIANQLTKLHKSNLDKINKSEISLKEYEKKIKSQKNILSKEDYTQEVSKFKKKNEDYLKERKNLVNNFNKKKLESSGKLIETIRPILAEYSSKNSISLILEKKNVIIGKSELDITQDILKLIDKKITKININ